MKLFDLEAAKRGEPVITRSGVPVTVVYFNYRDRCVTDAHILAVVHCSNGRDEACSFLNNGQFYPNETDDLDLFMAPKKVTRWMNIDSRGSLYFNGALCATEDEANRCATIFRVACVKVEWEE